MIEQIYKKIQNIDALLKKMAECEDAYYYFMLNIDNGLWEIYQTEVIDTEKTAELVTNFKALTGAGVGEVMMVTWYGSNECNENKLKKYIETALEYKANKEINTIL